MINDPSINVYEIVAEAESYFQNIDKEAKGSGWKAYNRWLYENEPKFYPSGDRSNVDPFFVSKQYLKNNILHQRSLFDDGWEELGPYYIEQVTGHYAVGLGRVESFYSDPNDPNRIYLGSRSGGFWKTTDGGTTWKGGAQASGDGDGIYRSNNRSSSGAGNYAFDVHAYMNITNTTNQKIRYVYATTQNVAYMGSTAVPITVWSFKKIA